MDDLPPALPGHADQRATPQLQNGLDTYHHPNIIHPCYLRHQLSTSANVLGRCSLGEKHILQSVLLALPLIPSRVSYSLRASWFIGGFSRYLMLATSR